jgi:drug/metabolite transporter (DMT)-like permease
MTTTLKILLLACLWGPSYLFIKLAVEEVPPLTMQVGRVGIAALILVLVVWYRGTAIPRSIRVWKLLTVQGVLSAALPFNLFAYGEQYIESSLAAMINGVVPMVTAVSAHFLLKGESLTPRRFWGVIVGLVGFLCLLGPTLFDGSIESDTVGICAIFAACLSYGAGMVFARRYLSDLPPLVAPMGLLLTASCYLIPLALLIDQPQSLPYPSSVAIGSILFLAVMGTAGAFILYYNIIQTAGATSLSSVAYLLPVVGSLLGVLVRNEVLGLSQLVAFGIILFGMYLINGAVEE